MMRFFIVGDIMGNPGRGCLRELMPKIRDNYCPDVILANAENAAGGFGLTKKVFLELTEKIGVDCLTMGNHWHDKPEILDFLPNTPKVLLPANMENVRDENDGLRLYEGKNGQNYAVINLIGKVFMAGRNRCPFEVAQSLMAKIPPSVKIRIVDVHAEASSEKQALAHFLSGQVSMIYGTHTHCPTADERIIGQHTGYMTDVGMTGSYDSVVGISKEAALHRFLHGERKKFVPAKGDPWLCAVVVDIDSETGRCLKIERLRWELNDFRKQAHGTVFLSGQTHMKDVVPVD
jgi:metallophosphoesterase (TIGR00282 family)